MVEVVDKNIGLRTEAIGAYSSRLGLENLLHLPEDLKIVRRELRKNERYQNAETTGCFTTLFYLEGANLGAPVRDFPVPLADISTGIFLSYSDYQINFVHRSGRGIDLANFVDYARFLGRMLVTTLECTDFIQSVEMPADDYTPWQGYQVGPKGAEFLDAFRSKDKERTSALFEEFCS